MQAKKISKRDGVVQDFNINKISQAIDKALREQNISTYGLADHLAGQVTRRLDFSTPVPVEKIQDIVEIVLISNGYHKVAIAYSEYRAKRTDARQKRTKLMKIFDELTLKPAKESDTKRSNGNVDGDSAMGTMLSYGSEGAKAYNLLKILRPEHAKAHTDGDIHIHDLDFLTLTMTCCQIDIKQLLKDGFSTGHGFLREPSNIQSAAALACIAIQANQNDQHGGQSIPNFDTGLAHYVAKTYVRELCDLLYIMFGSDDFPKIALNNYLEESEHIMDEKGKKVVYDALEMFGCTGDVAKGIMAKAKERTEKSTHQAMESLVHNLNTMHSRAGAQVPFSSINYGTDTSEEGRMIIRNVLRALWEGLGKGETPIFPIHIFRVKEGVNYNPTDPNYDLFKDACMVSAKRLFPNFSFIDAPFNLKYYEEGRPETEVAYMGCRTRVMANAYDSTKEIAFGRGNLSFTTINLPRLAIEAKGDRIKFFDSLNNMMDLVIGQLLDRMEIQAQKTIKNFPFLMGQGIWLDSEKLKYEEEVREIIKHGTLSLGFIGLAETLKALTGKHHGESEESYQFGLSIIKFMRDKLDKKTAETKLNFTLLATPAEGLSGRFTRIDREKYGIIEGVTDKEWYTNSFHIPVEYYMNAFDKIRKEAPFHALTNAGHITYIELDGDPLKNLEAFESIIRYMKESGIGYGSINHPVDRDPVCGYTGVIDNECPQCHRKEAEDGVGFERIRRITGYLVGTVERFNDAKKAEEAARIKHGTDIEKI